MIAIAVESPLQDDMRRLVAALNEELLGLTPREFTHHLTVEQLAGPETTLFIARDAGEAVGCGALRRHEGAIGEVKRMYTHPAHRGRGIGARVLAAITVLAEQEGLRELVLETGNNFDAAMQLYARAGFARCEPVLGYPDSPYTAFYRKPLTVPAAAVQR